MWYGVPRPALTGATRLAPLAEDEAEPERSARSWVRFSVFLFWAFLLLSAFLLFSGLGAAVFLPDGFGEGRSAWP